MFTLQVGTLIQRLMGAGMPARQADAMAETFGNCTQQLKHNGPVELNYDFPRSATPDAHGALNINTPSGTSILSNGNVQVVGGHDVYINGQAVADSINSVIIFGKLNGSLTAGGSTTLSKWKYTGVAWVDTGVDYTAIDRLQRGNEALPSGTWVTAVLVSPGVYAVTGAETN